MNLIDPNIDLTPAKCNENIAISTLGPLCAILPERGGYTVHPVPTPLSTTKEPNKSRNAGGSSQNLILFSRGNAISGLVKYKGINHFPNPPISTGITKKNIIIKPCAVIILLYNWGSFNILPGCANSERIKNLKAVPINPDQIPKIKYNVPISL